VRQSESHAAPTFQTVQRNWSLRAKEFAKEASMEQRCSEEDSLGTDEAAMLRWKPEKEPAWDRKISAGSRSAQEKRRLPSPAFELDPRKVGAGGDTSPHYFVQATPAPEAGRWISTGSLSSSR
jgi:hypothetical protein